MRGSIPNPCPQVWAALRGDDRRRHCEQCGKDVHEVDAYSDDEWHALVEAGPVCGYLAPEVTAPPPSRRSLMAGVLLTTIAPLLAQTGEVQILVVDATDAPIGRAEVTMVAADNRERKMRADEVGIAAFAGLPLGTSKLRIESPGFQAWNGTYMVSGAGRQLKVSLSVGGLRHGHHSLGLRIRAEKAGACKEGQAMRPSIPNPCPRTWTALPGDDRRRHCDDCGKDVHAVAAYTDGEWQALCAAGPVCGYIAGETASPLRSRRAMMAGALLTAISPVLAQTGSLLVEVKDGGQLAIQNAEILLTGPDRRERKARTDESGVASLNDLPYGDCKVRVQVPGFQTWNGTHTVAGKGNLTVTLTVGTVGEVVQIEPAPIPRKREK